MNSLLFVFEKGLIKLNLDILDKLVCYEMYQLGLLGLRSIFDLNECLNLKLTISDGQLIPSSKLLSKL